MKLRCGSKRQTDFKICERRAGFTFEDEVAANLMAEMLAGQRSLGDDYGGQWRTSDRSLRSCSQQIS